MRKFLAPALLALGVCAGQVFAQTTAQPSQQPGQQNQGASRTPGVQQRNGTDEAGRTRQAAQPGQAGAAQDALTKHITVGLVLGNEEEIAISKFGQERAQNEQVKQFAQNMIEQHQQYLSKLQQAAPQTAQMDLTLEGAEGEVGIQGDNAGARPGQSPAAGNQRRAAAGGAGGNDEQQMAQFMKQVKQQCLHLTTSQLARQQGQDFDKAFMGVQTGLHTGMLAKLQIAEQHVQDDQMKQLIQQGIQTTQQHLQQAQQIMEQLDAAGAGETRAAAGPAGERAIRQ